MNPVLVQPGGTGSPGWSLKKGRKTGLLLLTLLLSSLLLKACIYMATVLKLWLCV